MKTNTSHSEKQLIVPHNTQNSESINIDPVLYRPEQSQDDIIKHELNILHFYTNKLNDIFSSFFIKYFNKLKDNHDKIKDFQTFLYNISYDKYEIEKGLTVFEIYSEKKYKLTFEDLNTAIYIYIKESLQKILNKKVGYEKNKDSKYHLLNTFFYKCFKQICTNLYENPTSINRPLDFKKNIIHSVKYTLYNIIPFDYTIKYYDDNSVSKVSKDDTSEKVVNEKKHESVKKYFYSDNNISKESSDKKNKKSNKSYSKKKNKLNSTNTISNMSYEHDSS